MVGIFFVQHPSLLLLRVSQLACSHQEASCVASSFIRHITGCPCTDCVSITSFEVRNEIEIYPQSKGRREKMFFNAPFLLRAPVDFHAASLQEPCSKMQNRGSLLGGIERERDYYGLACAHFQVCKRNSFGAWM